MNVWLPVVTLILGLGLGEGAAYMRESRADRKASRAEWRAWRRSYLTDALTALDEVYNAAADIALNSDVFAADSTLERDEDRWAKREPYVRTLGAATFRVRRLAVLETPGSPVKDALQQVADLGAEMNGDDTAREVRATWKRVTQPMINARELLGAEVRAMYATAS